MKGKVPQSLILSHKVTLSVMFIKDESRIVIENNAMKCYDWILVSATVMGTVQIELVMDAI